MTGDDTEIYFLLRTHQLATDVLEGKQRFKFGYLQEERRNVKEMKG